ncbi:MAG: hypothetical protein ACH36H_12220 [Candidatus Nanopelagicales bacterium]
MPRLFACARAALDDDDLAIAAITAAEFRVGIQARRAGMAAALTVGPTIYLSSDPR